MFLSPELPGQVASPVVTPGISSGFGILFVRCVHTALCCFGLGSGRSLRCMLWALSLAVLRLQSTDSVVAVQPVACGILLSQELNPRPHAPGKADS